MKDKSKTDILINRFIRRAKEKLTEMLKYESVNSSKLRQLIKKASIFYVKEVLNADDHIQGLNLYCDMFCGTVWQNIITEQNISTPNKIIDSLIKVDNYINYFHYFHFCKIVNNEKGPRFTILELLTVISELQFIWKENQDHLIETGYLEKKINDDWLSNLMVNLYPVKKPYKTVIDDSKKEKSQIIKLMYVWGDALETCSYKEAPINDSFIPEDADRIEKSRELLFDLYLLIFQELYETLKNKDYKDLWNNCVKIVRNSISPDDLNFLLRIDYYSNKRFIEDSGDRLFSTLPELPFYSAGCLLSLFSLICHIEEELTVGLYSNIVMMCEVYFEIKNSIPPEEEIYIKKDGKSLSPMWGEIYGEYLRLIYPYCQITTNFFLRFYVEFKNEFKNFGAEAIIYINKKELDENKNSHYTSEFYADWKEIAETGYEEFKHSPDYRSVYYKDKTYNFTTDQARIIQYLHEAYCNKTPSVSQNNLLDRLGSDLERLRDLFKKGKTMHEAWGKLIIFGHTKGTFKLNLKN